MDWLILYGDRTTFSSDQGAWEDAPGWNCQVVLYRDPELGWTQCHGAKGGSRCDFFRLAEDGTVVGMGLDGMIGYAINELGIAGPETDLVKLIYVVTKDLGVFKQGKMLTRARWNDILLRWAIPLRNELRILDGCS